MFDETGFNLGKEKNVLFTILKNTGKELKTAIQ